MLCDLGQVDLLFFISSSIESGSSLELCFFKLAASKSKKMEEVVLLYWSTGPPGNSLMFVLLIGILNKSLLRERVLWKN